MRVELDERGANGRVDLRLNPRDILYRSVLLIDCCRPNVDFAGLERGDGGRGVRDHLKDDLRELRAAQRIIWGSLRARRGRLVSNGYNETALRRWAAADTIGAEISSVEGVFGEQRSRQGAEVIVDSGPIGFREVKHRRGGIRRIDAGDCAEGIAVDRIRLGVLDQRDREPDVLRGERCAVGPFEVRLEPKCDGQSVGADSAVALIGHRRKQLGLAAALPVSRKVGHREIVQFVIGAGFGDQRIEGGQVNPIRELEDMRLGGSGACGTCENDRRHDDSEDEASNQNVRPMRLGVDR